MKKSFVKNRWSEKSASEEARRKEKKQKLAQQAAPWRPQPQKKAAPPPSASEPKQTKTRPTPRFADVLPITPSEKANKKKKTPEWRQSWGSIRNISSKPDVMILQLAMILLAVGLVMVFSSSSYEALMINESGLYYFVRQMIFAVLGIIMMFVMMFINPSFVRRVALPLLIVFALLILYTTFFTVAEYGAKRWIALGPIKFMPSDFAKPLAVVVLASMLSNLKVNLENLGTFLKIMAGVFFLVGLIAIEDLGTAIAFFGVMFAMLIVAGAPLRYILVTLLSGIGAMVAAIIVEPYRMRRITGFLHPFSADGGDGSSYQLLQSLYAFGDGGFLGVGLGHGGQKMSHLFAAHTDFIYAIIGEELGLIGALCVLALFVAFGWRGFWLAMHIQDRFKSYTVFGLTAFIVFQALINMSVAVGVMPVTGITLPFISYGGTSLVVTLSMVGFMLNLSRYVEQGKGRSRSPER